MGTHRLRGNLRNCYYSEDKAYRKKMHIVLSQARKNTPEDAALGRETKSQKSTRA